MASLQHHITIDTRVGCINGNTNYQVAKTVERLYR
jgi:hypothetical protein